MTGYGRSSALHGNLEITIEVHSVNRKALDANITMPREWQLLEGSLLRILKEKISRGRVVVTIQAQFTSDSGSGEFDKLTINSLYDQFRSISNELGVAFNPSPEFLFQLALYSKKNQVLPDAEMVKESLCGAFSQAVDALVEMRKSEGSKLKVDLAERLDLLKAGVKEVAAHAGDSVPQYRELLFQRLRQADLELNLDDERVLKEIALFADRCDIAEEITRLNSHLDQLGQFLDAEGSVGRKIDFLLQEMNREINTIGSKSNDIRITRHVIDFKNELERLREQIANIE
ncbi:MAG: YicC family protein [Verrucomicrobia bacterium]|nr:YicC family protein [Verrucomicrobiota bacterium]